MFRFWTLAYNVRFFDVFGGSKKRALAQCVLPKLTLFMYGLHSLHGQFSGFHFFTSLLKALILVKFFISKKTMFQI